MIAIGTKFYGHDSAACIIDTSRQTIAAASSERFSRIKHDGTFCIDAISRLLDGTADVISHSFADFEQSPFQEETSSIGVSRRMLELVKRRVMRPRYLSDLEAINADEFHRQLSSFPSLQEKWRVLSEAQQVEQRSRDANHNRVVSTILELTSKLGGHRKVEFFDHHLCHAFAAISTCPPLREPRLVVTLDGQGDGFFSKAYLFHGHSFREVGRSPACLFDGSQYPASIGWIYSLFTLALGFRPNADEGKVEALAAFGRPIPALSTQLRAATFITEKGIGFIPTKISRFLNLRELLDSIDGYPKEDVAATVQSYLEETVVSYLHQLRKVTDAKNLVLVGGVAANIILNLAVYERCSFGSLHICPFMGDEGTAVGAAILSLVHAREDVSWLSDQKMPYWGTSYSREDVLEAILSREGIRVRDIEKSWTVDAAQSIAQKKIIAVFHGRMEFGPRALGHRSILANPADPSVRERMNVSIKRRPPWQPFCPSILESERERLFKESFPHKHMAIAFRLKEEHLSAVPAAVHVDGTARPQFVSLEDDESFYRLLTAVKELTGYGMVLNTSFNLHGRTIVESPSHAIDDFLDCNLDALYIEGFKVTRA